METAKTPGKVGQPVKSVTKTIGHEGGSLQADGVSLRVPEGTFSIPTRVCMDTYLDEREMGLYNEQERAVSPVVQLSTPLSTEKFNKPLQLSLRPEVALKTRKHETGWQLKLKTSDSSTEGKPSKWYTALKLNTDTETVEKESSFIHYDPGTQTLHVNAVGYMAWLGKPHGIGSMRDVRYALFGQQLQARQCEWKISAHIIHGSSLVYEQIAETMKSKLYEELTVPIKDRIGIEGTVRMSVEFPEPWQMVWGKAVTYIPTKRIWNTTKDAACYYEFTLQSKMGSADTLKCTVEALFQHTEQEGFVDNPVNMVVTHSLNKRRSKRRSDSEESK